MAQFWSHGFPEFLSLVFDVYVKLRFFTLAGPRNARTDQGRENFIIRTQNKVFKAFKWSSFLSKIQKLKLPQQIENGSTIFRISIVSLSKNYGQSRIVLLQRTQVENNCPNLQCENFLLIPIFGSENRGILILRYYGQIVINNCA